MIFKSIRLIVRMFLLIGALLYLIKDSINESIFAVLLVVWMNQEWPHDASPS